jgi:hypothetical protein
LSPTVVLSAVDPAKPNLLQPRRHGGMGGLLDQASERGKT